MKKHQFYDSIIRRQWISSIMLLNLTNNDVYLVVFIGIWCSDATRSFFTSMEHVRSFFDREIK